jgi:hypothetical protein
MRRRFLLLAVVSILALFCSNSFARYNYGYAYHGGRWHSHGWFGFDYAVGYPPVGVIVASLPFGYTRIIYAGVPYYYYDNVYFSACPGGYIVVPAPQPQEEVTPAASEGEDNEQAVTATAKVSKNSDLIVVNIPKKSGGFIPVKLTKHGSGYIGPQGEFYAGHPTVEQLSVLYGE